jgi:flagellin-like protein
MKLRGNRKRLGIAEIMGTLIMVAITLIAGAAVFGWIDGQAGSSENAYGESVAANVNFLKESFSVVATSEFPTSCIGGPCQNLTLVLYNRGEVTFTVSSITIATMPSDPNAWSMVFNMSAYGPAICRVAAITPNQKVVGNLLKTSTLSNPPYQVSIPACWGNQMTAGESYAVTIQGVYGSVVQTMVRANG